MNLPQPKNVLYTLKDTELKELFSQCIKEQTGLDIDVIIDYDEKTYSLQAYLSDEDTEKLSEEDYEKLFGEGNPMYHIDEWCINAISLLHKVFKIKPPIDLIAYAAEENTHDWDSVWAKGNFNIDIIISLEHYVNNLCSKESIQVK